MAAARFGSGPTSVGCKDAVLQPVTIAPLSFTTLFRGGSDSCSHRVPNTCGDLLCTVIILFGVAKYMDLQCLVIDRGV